VANKNSGLGFEDHLNDEPNDGEKFQREGERGLAVLLLAERARSECARSTRAIEDQPGHAPPEKTGASLRKGRGYLILVQRAQIEFSQPLRSLPTPSEGLWISVWL